MYYSDLRSKNKTQFFTSIFHISIYRFLTWILRVWEVSWVICCFLTLPRPCGWVVGCLLSMYILPLRVLVNPNKSRFPLILPSSLTEIIGSAPTYLPRPEFYWLTIWVLMNITFQPYYNERRLVFSVLPFLYTELHVAPEVIFYFLTVLNNAHSLAFLWDPL